MKYWVKILYIVCSKYIYIYISPKWIKSMVDLYVVIWTYHDNMTLNLYISCTKPDILVVNVSSIFRSSMCSLSVSNLTSKNARSALWLYIFLSLQMNTPYCKNYVYSNSSYITSFTICINGKWCTWCNKTPQSQVSGSCNASTISVQAGWASNEISS